jgi:TonB family protein
MATRSTLRLEPQGSVPIAKAPGSEPRIPGPLDEILHKACLLTNAHGGAIALAEDDALVCRATTGGTAPDLGSRVNCDSGISGECVRSGKTLYCEDAETDGRVDAAACRFLGVRSIVVLPLLLQGDVVGVFEVFCSRPGAFNDRQIRILESLVGSIVEAATDLVSARPRIVAPLHFRTLPMEPARQAEPAPEQAVMNRRLVLWVLLAAAVVFLLLVGYLWKRKQSVQPTISITSDAMTPAASPAPPSTQERAIDEPPPASRSDVRSQDKQDSYNPSTPAKISKDHKTAARGDLDSTTLTLKAPKDMVPPPTPQVAELPRVPADSRSELMATIMAVPVTLLPESQLLVSQGVTGRQLIRQINPVYPASAKAAQIEGDVVLSALIERDGRVQEVQVISGPQVFHTAATRAIKSWEYRPAYLNGKPIEWKSQITLKFRLH